MKKENQKKRTGESAQSTLSLGVFGEGGPSQGCPPLGGNGPLNKREWPSKEGKGSLFLQEKKGTHNEALG